MVFLHNYLDRKTTIRNKNLGDNPSFSCRCRRSLPHLWRLVEPPLMGRVHCLGPLGHLPVLSRPHRHVLSCWQEESHVGMPSCNLSEPGEVVMLILCDLNIHVRPLTLGGIICGNPLLRSVSFPLETSSSLATHATNNEPRTAPKSPANPA